MVFKWSRDQIEKFIICVEQNSCIYNVKSREYLNRNKKSEAFNSILKEMQIMESCITLEEIKRKWKSLRTQYMQEVRSIHQSKKSGSGRGDVYVPKLWCFENLNFLKTHTEMRKSHDNTEVTYQDKENNIENNTPTIHDEESLSEEPPKKRQKTSGAVKGFRKDLESFKTVLSQRKAEKKFAWLGILVTNIMEQISPEDQDDAAWQVQCLMRKLKSKSPENACTSSSSSFSKDILELSMEGLFDEEDVN